MLNENKGGRAVKTSGGAGSGETACCNSMSFRVPPLRTPFYLSKKPNQSQNNVTHETCYHMRENQTILSAFAVR